MGMDLSQYAKKSEVLLWIGSAAVVVVGAAWVIIGSYAAQVEGVTVARFELYIQNQAEWRDEQRRFNTYVIEKLDEFHSEHVRVMEKHLNDGVRIHK